MGLNNSVCVALLLKTKCGGNNYAFVTLFVLDNLKCPEVTQNHELINLVKLCISRLERVLKGL